MILFLDFDGVLHPQFEGGMVPEDVAFCHRDAFESVMRDFPSVQIVISSTWRLVFDMGNLRNRFSADIGDRIVGTTPLVESTQTIGINRREVEILEWLSASGKQAEPWLALDDAPWLFGSHRDRVVVCQSMVGFDPQAELELRSRLLTGL